MPDHVDAVTVYFDWGYRGEWYAFSEYSSAFAIGGFSTSSIDSALSVDLLRNEASNKRVVSTAHVEADYGQTFLVEVNDSGKNSRYSLVSKGDTLRSSMMMRNDLATDTAALTTARAYVDLNDPAKDWGVFGGQKQKWVFHIEDGWSITDCG